MYHLSKAVYLYLTRKEEYSILLLGLDNAGKTTLLNQIKTLYQPTTASSTASTSAAATVPTVGQNVTVLSLPELYLKVWDVGGQQSLRKLWTSYYASCHAIVFVVDSTDVGDSTLPNGLRPLSSSENTQDSLKQSREGSGGGGGGGGAAASKMAGEGATATGQHGPHGRLLESAAVLEDILAHTSTRGIPVLVLANKQDAEDCVEVVRIKEGLVRPVFEGERGAGVRDSRVLPVSAKTGTGVREAVEWVCSRVRWNREARPPVMR